MQYGMDCTIAILYPVYIYIYTDFAPQGRGTYHRSNSRLCHPPVIRLRFTASKHAPSQSSVAIRPPYHAPPTEHPRVPQGPPRRPPPPKPQDAPCLPPPPPLPRYLWLRLFSQRFPLFGPPRLPGREARQRRQRQVEAHRKIRREGGKRKVVDPRLAGVRPPPFLVQYEPPA